MSKHAKILGYLFIAFGALSLVVGGVFMLLFFGAGEASGEAAGEAIGGAIGGIIGGLTLLTALPSLAAGFGLLGGKNWARLLAIVVGLVSLVNVPVGTALGAYALWALLLDEETKRSFGA